MNKVTQPRNWLRASFENRLIAGYDVRWIRDGARPLEFGGLKTDAMPEQWHRPHKVIEPKIAILDNATLYPNGSALLSTAPEHSRILFTGGLRNPTNLVKMNQYDFQEYVNQHAWLYEHPIVVPVPGRSFSTSMEYFRNFGHFIADILSRIYYEDLGVITPNLDKIIAPWFKFPMQKVLFEKIFASYEIVQSPTLVKYEVENLVIPANMCNHWNFNPNAIAALARRMRRIMKPYIGPEKFKICVSRNDGSDSRERDFVNYGDFEKLVREFGYRVIETSTLAPESQLALWANATDIIGIHGAGMMNMIMMPRGNYTEITNAPMLRNNKIRNSGPARCAMAAGHSVKGIASKRDEQGRPVIDLRQVEKVLLENA